MTNVFELNRKVLMNKKSNIEDRKMVITVKNGGEGLVRCESELQIPYP